ncbi:MAG: SpoIID/LytB domain-containing protein [Pirellulales bacterium]
MSRWTLIALATAAIAGVAAIQLLSVSPESIAPSGQAEFVPSSGLPSVRVLLGDVSRERFSLRIDGPYRVLGEDQWSIVAQGHKLGETSVEAEPEGIRIGERDFPAPRLSIEVQRDGDLWVDDRRYRGSLQLIRRDDGPLSVVNVVPVEDYVASVLPSEMPADFPLAAQQAQAIVARSFVLYQMKTTGENRDYDVFDSQRSQAYGGMQYVADSGRALAVESAASRRVIDQTRGMVLVYGDRLFCTYYAAVCGDHTLRGSDVFGDAAPPLVGVACVDCSDAPRYRWRQELLREQFEPKLRDYLVRIGEDVGQIRSIHSAVDDPARLPQVIVRGNQAEAQVSSVNFRLYVLGAADAASARYELKLDGDRLDVHGRGWGHSVGLCQWGARGRAERGHDCHQILGHYYPGSELRVLE